MVVVALSIVEIEGRRLSSLRPGSAEGWVSIPDPPIDVMHRCMPSLCCVEEVLYIAGGLDEGGAQSAALQAFDLSTRSWTARAPVPEPRSNSACVQLAGRLYVVSGAMLGGDGNMVVPSSVFSYDPRTDRWRSESPLPLGQYRTSRRLPALAAVSHEGRLVVVGLEAAPPLVLVDDVWTELPMQPFQFRPRFGSAWRPNAASLCVG